MLQRRRSGGSFSLGRLGSSGGLIGDRGYVGLAGHGLDSNACLVSDARGWLGHYSRVWRSPATGDARLPSGIHLRESMVLKPSFAGYRPVSPDLRQRCPWARPPDGSARGLSFRVKTQGSGLGYHAFPARTPSHNLGRGWGSGVQPAIARAQSRALALSMMPGNRRRNSMAADSSPSFS